MKHSLIDSERLPGLISFPNNKLKNINAKNMFSLVYSNSPIRWFT